MKQYKIKPPIQDDIYSEEYYHLLNSRDFYKGTSFRMSE